MSNRSRPVRYWPGKKTGPESDNSESEQEEYEYTSDSNQPFGEPSGEPLSDLEKDNIREETDVKLEYPSRVIPPAAVVIKPVKTEINIKSEPASLTSTTTPILPRVKREDEDEEIKSEIKSESSGFEDEDEEMSEDESSSDEEESSSDEEETPTLIRPVFINKKSRDNNNANKATVGNSTEDIDSNQRRQRALETVEEGIRKEITMAESLKSLNEDLGNVDDTDGLDPEVEYNAWKLRELKRIKREREVLELFEKEQDEIDRRRNLTEEERLKEDKAKLDLQEQQRRERKGNGASMNKYYHKGVFYQTEENKELFNRDYQSSANVDDYKDKSVLPEALQVRGGLIGLRGQTKYKGMKSEDTTVDRKDDLYQMAKSRGGGGHGGYNKRAYEHEHDGNADRNKRPRE